MSGRQYNMYNTTAAEAWKQRVQKENMHNAPSLRQFADLNLDDDDARSVSSMASGRSAATGVTRDSRASIASTAALKRIEELEAKLEVERRKRQEIEDQLKEVQTVVKQATSQGLDTKGA